MQRGNSQLKYKRWLITAIVLGVVVFIGLTARADFKSVIHAFSQFRYSYIPLILSLTLVDYVIRAVKWDFYLRTLGIRVKIKDSFAIFLSGLTMSITPARLGEMFKSYWLNKLNGAEISRTIPVVIVERITDLFGLAVLAAISFSSFSYGKWVLTGMIIVLIVIVIIIRSRRMSTKMLNYLDRIPVIKRFSGSLRNSYESAYTLFGFKNLAIAIALSVISWGFECLALYFVLIAFGIDQSVLLSIFVFSFATIAGAVSMIPGGLIMAEGSMTLLLVLLAGIPEGVAASATIIVRICTLWFGIALGLIATMIISRKIGRITKKGEDTINL
ncbi:MAG: lysylphosphatidylglycerol synthase transmembrane domain-containing protein [Chloroflexi bacterium]|nr:lysylphosphatidylglycerol synthase transmembrane domain-containing protein [Chloroflexota bacterium]